MAGRTRALIACIAVAMVILPWRPAAADDLPQPAGRVILTVSGNITRTNNGDGADFDLDMLHALGTQAMSTSTSWTDGTQNFSGVSMRALMATVGAEGKTVEAVALNDHRQMIELEDFSLYPVILARS